MSIFTPFLGKKKHILLVVILAVTALLVTVGVVIVLSRPNSEEPPVVDTVNENINNNETVDLFERLVKQKRYEQAIRVYRDSAQDEALHAALQPQIDDVYAAYVTDALEKAAEKESTYNFDGAAEILISATEFLGDDTDTAALQEHIDSYYDSFVEYKFGDILTFVDEENYWSAILLLDTFPNTDTLINGLKNLDTETLRLLINEKHKTLRECCFENTMDFSIETIVPTSSSYITDLQNVNTKLNDGSYSDAYLSLQSAVESIPQNGNSDSLYFMALRCANECSDISYRTEALTIATTYQPDIITDNTDLYKSYIGVLEDYPAEFDGTPSLFADDYIELYPTLAQLYTFAEQNKPQGDDLTALKTEITETIQPYVTESMHHYLQFFSVEDNTPYSAVSNLSDALMFIPFDDIDDLLYDVYTLCIEQSITYGLFDDARAAVNDISVLYPDTVDSTIIDNWQTSIDETEPRYQEALTAYADLIDEYTTNDGYSTNKFIHYRLIDVDENGDFELVMRENHSGVSFYTIRDSVPVQMVPSYYHNTPDPFITMAACTKNDERYFVISERHLQNTSEHPPQRGELLVYKLQDGEFVLTDSGHFSGVYSEENPYGYPEDIPTVIELNGESVTFEEYENFKNSFEPIIAVEQRKLPLIIIKY